MSVAATELLLAAAGRVLVDEDGNQRTIRLLEPLSAAELAQLEALIPCQLPPDARDLLALARSFEGGPLESMDFSGLMEPMFEELFACGLPIAHDGFGNYWIVDLTADSSSWGPIFYVCHDPPVIAYQCPDIATFIADVLVMCGPPYKGPINDVHERHSMRIWRENPGAVTRADALTSSDPVVRGFAAQLTSGHFVIDMRNARIGDGFSWGRFGPKTSVQRAGAARLFAVRGRPKSFLGRLFGRGQPIADTS